MSTKTISITDEAYGRLNNRKKDRESFSEVILRLTGKRSLAGFAGIFSGMEAKELEANVLENREASKRRVKRLGI
ncbi:MAG: antitoxin VapB family protein [Candidatus Diapherotrites archaeon]|nr:antitoxin VapB family protein [Candidatus Diapherotrites archaeon]